MFAMQSPKMGSEELFLGIPFAVQPCMGIGMEDSSAGPQTWDGNLSVFDAWTSMGK